MPVAYVSAANVRAALHSAASCIIFSQFDQVATSGTEETLNLSAENVTKIFTIN